MQGEQRDKLWGVWAYPCVGQFKFVSITIQRQNSYERIVESLKGGARYLDIGCAIGQDMRYLALDGCPSTNMFGLEKVEGFVDASYDFFGDRQTLATRFIIADLMDRTNQDAEALKGTVDVAHVGMFLHLWDLEGQTQACERITEFMSSKPGTLVVGNSVGRTKAGIWEWNGGKAFYKHNVESFTSMWKEVGRRTGTNWEVRGWMHDGLGLNGEKGHWDDPLTTRLMWEVERI